MNHKMYRDCVYIHNGIIHTIRRVNILIVRVWSRLLINWYITTSTILHQQHILIQSLTLYTQNNCSIWCWWKTVEVYKIAKMYIEYVSLLSIFSISRLIMVSLWRHSAPNLTERYIFWKCVNITIKLVNCFYSMSSIIFW